MEQPLPSTEWLLQTIRAKTSWCSKLVLKTIINLPANLGLDQNEEGLRHAQNQQTYLPFPESLGKSCAFGQCNVEKPNAMLCEDSKHFCLTTPCYMYRQPSAPTAQCFVRLVGHPGIAKLRGGNNSLKSLNGCKAQ